MDQSTPKKANVGYSCLDSLGKLKIVSILNFLQDAASEHASLMGVSGFDLARKNLAWVIARYQIEIETFPNWMDDIKIETWRTPVKKHLRVKTVQDNQQPCPGNNKSQGLLGNG